MFFCVEIHQAFMAFMFKWNKMKRHFLKVCEGNVGFCLFWFERSAEDSHALENVKAWLKRRPPHQSCRNSNGEEQAQLHCRVPQTARSAGGPGRRCVRSRDRPRPTGQVVSFFLPCPHQCLLLPDAPRRFHMRTHRLWLLLRGLQGNVCFIYALRQVCPVNAFHAS